jgi:citrate synthase
MSSDRLWLDADEAARTLRVARTTLYAYVSRGFVRSQPRPGASRERRYSRDDVERLRRRTEERRDPGKAAARALHWGIPVLESALTMIDGTRLFYRGHDAVGLSRSRSVAEVASLLWTGRFDAAPANGLVPGPGGAGVDASLSFVQRAQTALAAASARDPLAFDLRAGSVALTGWRVVTLLTRAAAPTRAPAATIDGLLAKAWRVDRRGAGVLRAALILCADHELNVSSFTARCVASAGSNPYAVVTAGLSALEGTKHGGASARAESMMDALLRARPVKTAVAGRLRRGEPIDGFGHPLYRDGDPRAAALLDLLRERYPKSGELAFVLDVAGAAAAAMRERPNVDFALAAVARVLHLPPGSPLMLFAIGRSIGWIGHAIEQYETGQLIRPRARYVGITPAPLDRLKIED